MNIKRLQKLSQFLRDLDKKLSDPSRNPSNRNRARFSLEDWSTPYAADAYINNSAYGYSACAIGHALLAGIFKEEGLHYNISLQTNKIVPILVAENGAWSAIKWNAILTFFDISMSTAEYLFDNGSYKEENNNINNITATSVADRIDTYIRDTTGDNTHAF